MDFNELKFLKLNQNISKQNKIWTRLYPILKPNNDTSSTILYIENIRIILKSRNISSFLERNIYICSKISRLEHSTIYIKFAALIEEHIMDGKKIVYNQLDNTWIIPINLSLIVVDNLILNPETDIFCVQDVDEKDYYFEIQTVNASSNLQAIRFFHQYETCIMKKPDYFFNELDLDNDDPDFYFCYSCEIDRLFIVIWEHVPLIKLDSYGMEYYDIQTGGFLCDKIIKQCDFKK